MDDGLTEVPSIIPARMINEFVYCPRFFHLGFVGRESGENDNTVEGKWAHRRVDDPSGSFERGEVRSLSLSSEELGMSARVDVVREHDGELVPIEYKTGSPLGRDHPVWLPERVQLAVAGLLLRAEGHRCNHGEVWFTGSRTRERVEIDDELRDVVTDALRRIRQVAADPVPPPPLEDSPKCPSCIYVGICLPDEQMMLRGRRCQPPRRLLPSDDAATPLYVSEPGARVGRRGDRIVVTVQNESIGDERLIDVSQLVVFGNVSISTQLVRELLGRSIPVSYFSSGGWFAGVTTGLPSKNVELRRRQAMISERVEVSIARRMVEAKILNARVLLRRNGRPRDDSALRDLKRLAIKAGQARAAGQLLGYEGAAARAYFSRFNTMLKSDDVGFDFTRRNRRPPSDRINALLSFAYGLLTREVTATALGVGLDPDLGVFHRPRFGRPALALDLAEEFRPLLADSIVLGLVNNGELRSRDFVEAQGSVSLTQQGRRRVIAAYERRMRTEFTHPMFKYKLTYRRGLEVQCRVLAAVLLGEFAEYTAVVTR